MEADTRTVILEHATSLMKRDGVAAVRIADVAAAAGVSRQAVYLHFQTRAGLLTEIARHHDLTTATGKGVRATLEVEPARDALLAFVRALSRHLPSASPVMLALAAAAATDDAARDAWRSRRQTVHDMLGSIVRRVADAGALADGWTVARATDWIFAKLDPHAWAELQERGWSVRAITAEVLADMARLVRPA